MNRNLEAPVLAVGGVEKLGELPDKVWNASHLVNLLGEQLVIHLSDQLFDQLWWY